MSDISIILLAALLGSAAVSIAALIVVSRQNHQLDALHERLLAAECQCAELSTALLAVEDDLPNPLADDPHALRNVEPVEMLVWSRGGSNGSHWRDLFYRN